jgi:peptide/nickel transport system permease protein
MSSFLLIYSVLLIGACCLAFYMGKKSIFLMLFSLIIISFVAGILGGWGGLHSIAIAAGLLTMVAGISFAFREILVATMPVKLSKEIKTAPLTAAFGMFVIFIYAVAGIFAPWIAPHGETDVIASAFDPANENMLLGADQLGRDMFSRIIYGTRNSVGLALLATSAAFFVGSVAGLYAAVRGGWMDQLLGRISDVLMSIPSLIFALLMLAIFGPTIVVLIIAVAIVYAPRVFRLVRSVAINVVVMDYIEAAKLRGEKNGYLIRKEILPNSTAPMIAEFGLEFCFVFLLLAGLSFLGLGIQPPGA